ncbi:MAG TPA: alpha/beta fold hydrolase, partial [Pyrinomonadaceae bacterium]|nr:alpha/beta fold hydrolase [Pyrinomonadaceae bacterium]
EIWGALLNGARLVVVEKEVALSALEFGQALREQEINTLFLTTALFNRLAQEGGGEIFRGVKQLLVGGEALDAHWIRAVLEQGGPERLLNGYGPTESTTFATWEKVNDVPAGASSIPIGRPVGNTTVYVMDQWLRPVPVGVRGELYIGGDGLARGYLNDALRTAERFVPHPYSGTGGERLYRTGDEVRYVADGRIEFLGRRDQQVKVRGYRIELGEIEAVLKSYAGVQQAVVIVSENEQLVAYVVGEREAGAELRSYLRERLPGFMVPAHFVMLEAMPLTPNGKINRSALPAPSIDREAILKGEYVAARNEIEERLVTEWSKLLGVERISVHDNFFDLGGHSLLATRAIFRLNEYLGMEVSLRHLFEAPTIAELASRIQLQLRPQNGSGRWTPVVRIQSGVSDRILFGVHDMHGSVTHYVQIARSLGPEQTVYALQARGSETEDSPHTDMTAMAASYIDAIREIQPDGPYWLTGYSFGGHIAFEMAQQLTAQGHEAQLILLDTHRWVIPDMPNGEFDDAIYCSSWLGDVMKLSQQERKSLSEHLRRLNPEERVEDIIERLKLSGVVKYDIPATRLRQKLRVQFSNAQALFNYNPAKYPMRITLVVAEESKEPSLDLGWRDLVSAGVDVHYVPGNHESMIKDPEVGAVGEVIRHCMAKVDGAKI